MSYEISFRSRNLTDIVVENARGERLKELWFDESKRNMPVEIEGNGYLLGDIKSVTRIPDPKPVIAEPVRRLSNGSQCKAQYSIHKAIIQHAMSVSFRRTYDNPQAVSWLKLIKDPLWKQTARTRLREQPNAKWCDNTLNECHCDHNIPADPNNFEHIRQVFFNEPKSASL